MFLIHNPKAILAYFLIFFFLFVTQVIFFDYSYAHKLLESPLVGNEQDKDNSNFGSALMIPNHTISWAIYQQLGGPDNAGARFYKFDNKQPNSNLYVHITIPKIDKYINFTPSLALIGPALKNINNDQMKEFGEKNTANKSGIIIDNNIVNKDKIPFDIPAGYQLIINSPFKGPIPSPVFYEPFTQTSYWERQEIKTKLNETGTYYIAVFDDFNNNGDGKYSLAVGKIEDFAPQDFFTLLPYTWIKVKLFFNDYLSIIIGSTVFIFFFVVLPLLALRIYKRKKRKTITN